MPRSKTHKVALVYRCAVALIGWSALLTLWTTALINHPEGSSDYLYPFLNLPQLGIGGLAAWVAVFLALFILLGAAYIGLNRIWGVQEEP